MRTYIGRRDDTKKKIGANNWLFRPYRSWYLCTLFGDRKNALFTDKLWIIDRTASIISTRASRIRYKINAFRHRRNKLKYLLSRKLALSWKSSRSGELPRSVIKTVIKKKMFFHEWRYPSSNETSHRRRISRPFSTIFFILSNRLNRKWIIKIKKTT